MKKIQKEYERKLRVNQNNDVFTTFQKSSHIDHSPIAHKRQKQQSLHQTQHEHIQSLKSTLKSLVPPSMELTKQFSRVDSNSQNDIREETIKNDEYMLKLTQLTKNLQELASKCYFSPANIQETTRQRANSGNMKKPRFQDSETISRYEPQTFFKYSNNVSVELPSRNGSFADKEVGKYARSQSKSNQKHDSSVKNIKYRKEEKNIDSSSKKAYNKKEIVSDLMKKQSNSKNLAKIFDSFQNSHTTDMMKARERSSSKSLIKVQTIFEQKVHRHKVTSILVADHIYTSSLDYSIKKIQEHQKVLCFQKIQKYREGVEHLALINGVIYSGSRDKYIRSLDGNFFCRFEHTPLTFEESERTNQITISFKNKELRLFDIDKRSTISSIQFQTSFQAINKFNKQLFVGTDGALFAVDWRKKDFLVNIYKDQTKECCNWLSDPFSRAFWLESQGQLTLLTPQHKKMTTKTLPITSSYVSHYWNRSGLYILINSESGNHLLKYDEVREVEQIDFDIQMDISRLVVRERQIIYGGKEGDIIIKQLKR